MPKYEPFPPDAEARYAVLSAALREYADEALALSESDDGYTTFRLRNPCADVDAFVVVARLNGRLSDDLIRIIERVCIALCNAVDGDPVASQHYAGPLQ